MFVKSAVKQGQTKCLKYYNMRGFHDHDHQTSFLRQNTEDCVVLTKEKKMVISKKTRFAY